MSEWESIVLGGGCFWCLEALYQTVPGVEAVTPGYAGGHTDDPSYEAVCAGQTGHAEVVKVDYDPDRVGLEGVLARFWQFHDPTTPNRQGNDVGTQYRSIILVSGSDQRTAAENSLRQAQPDFDRPIVTEIVSLEKFHPAETYHRDYFRNNPGAPYCLFVIRPKLEKARKAF